MRMFCRSTTSSHAILRETDMSFVGVCDLSFSETCQYPGNGGGPRARKSQNW